MFPLLGARPALGAAFAPDDEAESRRLVILSHGLWQQTFGGNPDVLGRALRLDGEAYTVVGIMPPAFAFPDREARAWTPFRVRPVQQPNGSTYLSMFGGLARLRPGVTPEQAAAEATARGRGAPDPGLVAVAVFGSRGPVIVTAEPLLESMLGEVRPALVILLAAVILLLAAATGNIASVQLARATMRRREMAVRSALGAGGLRLFRQSLLESLAVGMAGGIAGLALAALIHRALPALLPADFPRAADIAVDPMVLLFAAGATLAASVLFGIMPALEARRTAVTAALVEDGYSAAGGAGGSRRRAVIMAGQVAVAAILLIGATLMIRSFLARLSLDRGYSPGNVLTARLPLPETSYTSQRRSALVETILTRLRGTPGVLDAGVTTVLPLTGSEAVMAFTLPPAAGASDAPQQVHAAVRTVSPGYLDAMRIRLVEGRALQATDTATSQPVLLVNRAFARQYLADRAVGRSLPLAFEEGKPHWEIAGVVADVLPRSVTDPPSPEVYVSYRQLTAGLDHSEPTFVIRTTGDPTSFVPLLRNAVRAQDASLALDAVMTMEDRVMDDLARPRLYALLLGGFAAFASLIAAVGLFGVLAYSVAQRSREIGIRTALGARPLDVARLVVSQGLVITLAGLVAGVWASAALTRVMSSLLFGVTPHDPATFVAVPAGLLAVSAVACFVPARRAARVDPLQVLRAG
jgi:predicted permease